MFAPTTADVTNYRVLSGTAEVLTGRLTSTMGHTARTPDGTVRFHRGIDMAAPEGTPIYAPANALVSAVYEKPMYGKVVEITTEGETVTRFAHLLEFNVEPGQQVKAGEMIARVGSSGIAEKPHVHIETYVNNQRQNPMEVWRLSEQRLPR